MKLSELKKMIGEEYKKYLSEQDLDMVGAQPPMGMDPMVNVSGGDIDIEGDEDKEEEEDEEEDEDDDVSEKKKDKEDLKERFKKLANIIKD